MDGRRIPIFDDRQELVATNDRGALRAYRGVMLVDDPDELLDYARFLWWQWQAHNRQFGEAPAEPYTQQMFRVAATWLLDMYDDADASAPDELLRACRAILAADIAAEADKDGSNLPRGASLSQNRTEAAYEAAARFEATRPVGERPSVTEVARHLVETGLIKSPEHIRQKHAESNVIRWRKDLHYEGAVEHYRRVVFGPPKQ